ncbi:MAG: hypothetical protein Q9214_006334 [Letrouitia sp. 1 TL-2023]
MMEGMRYERGGKGKYWIPKPGEVNSRTPLLGPGSASSRASATTYSKLGRAPEDTFNSDTIHEDDFDAEDERLFVSARALEFGDWNYPVITAHVPSAERWFGSDPDLITTSTNRNLLQPTMANKAMRASKIQKDLDKGKRRTSSSSGAASKPRSRAPVLKELTREESSSSKSGKSGRSQLVDLVIEDYKAEETERVRARKEGGAAWNQDETKHFVRAYNDDDQGEDIRQGFEPPQVRGSLDLDRSGSESEDTQSKKEEHASGGPHFDGFDDRHVWDSKGN